MWLPNSRQDPRGRSPDRAKHHGSDIGTLVGQPPRLLQLYNPRSDRWTSCFVLNGVHIDPVNLTGEGTATLLQVNHANRIRERETLADAGRYPTIEALAPMKE